MTYILVLIALLMSMGDQNKNPWICMVLWFALVSSCSRGSA